MDKKFWEAYLESCEPTQRNTFGELAEDIIRFVTIGIIVVSMGVIAIALAGV